MILGSIIHGIIPMSFVKRNKFLPEFIGLKFADLHIIKEIMLSSLPRAFILSLIQIKILFFNSFTSHADVGNTSILNFSYNLQNVPLSLIGVSFVIAAFPILSKKHVNQDVKGFWDLYKYTAKKIFIYCGLATIAIWFLKDYIVLILLGNIEAYKIIALTLGIFSLSLIPQCIELLTIRTYYARGENKRPAMYSLFLTTFVILLAYFSDGNAMSIAKAFTIGSWISAFVLIISIRKNL